MENFTDYELMTQADYSAKKKIMENIMKNYYMDKIRNNVNPFNSMAWDDHQKEALAKYTMLFRKSPYMFITINPNYKDVSFERFAAKADRLFKNKNIKDYTYSYEIRNTQTKGFHLHGLIDRGGTPPSVIEREMRKMFEPICGHERHIHVRMIKDCDLEKVINYITKNKKLDVEWRKTKGLKDVYKK